MENISRGCWGGHVFITEGRERGRRGEGRWVIEMSVMEGMRKYDIEIDDGLIQWERSQCRYGVLMICFVD
jgi:hypothetical protein